MKEIYTAHQMALIPHNLSKDSMAATLKGGQVYRWGGSVWVGPMMRLPTDAKAPKAMRAA